MVRSLDDAEFTAQLARALSARARPTAVIASNSALALALLKALRALEVAVPRDLSVLLFDEPEWADVVAPPLAVVRHPTAAIARTAWELLIHRMRTPRAKPQRVVYAATLVPGPSIAPPRRR
jgi:LacI family transcriptional regulator